MYIDAAILLDACTIVDVVLRANVPKSMQILLTYVHTHAFLHAEQYHCFIRTAIFYANHCFISYALVNTILVSCVPADSNRLIGGGIFAFSRRRGFGDVCKSAVIAHWQGKPFGGANEEKEKYFMLARLYTKKIRYGTASLLIDFRNLDVSKL